MLHKTHNHFSEQLCQCYKYFVLVYTSKSAWVLCFYYSRMHIANDMYCMYMRAMNLRLQHYVLALQCRDNKVMYIIFDNEIRNLSKTLSTTKYTTRTRYQDTNKVYNQNKVPRYQQSVQPRQGTKIPTKCTTRTRYQDANKVYNQDKVYTKIPTKCTLCWYLGLLSWLWT